MFKKVISLALSVVFSLQTCGFAQAGQLNLAGYLGQGSGVPALDIFRPAHLRYFSYEPDSDNFQILLDKADEKDLSDGQVKDKADELMKYFRIGLSLPNDKFWVNLRPDAPEQIIDPALEQTDMGKIMLEADLQLKKDTSSLTSPQTKEGKEYWDKLYKKAGELFGTENITIPTITRPWIVPGEIIVRQSGSSAYIYKAALKVMLEEDYLRGMKDERRGTTTDYNFPDPRMKELNKYSTQLIRELIIPQLTKEVNRAKRYAGLRQVYYSLILARWFKQRYHNSGTSEHQSARVPVNENNTLAKLIDSGSLTNLTSQEPWSKDTYYQGYKKSFEQGEYNLSQTVHTPTGQLIRRYVSGGISAGSALEVNDHFDVGKVNNGIPVVGYKGVFFDGNSVEITVSSGIESKKPKVLTIKKFAHVFNEISWPDIGTVYSYSLESNPELGRRIVILRNNDGSSSKEADNRIVIRYGDRVLPSDIIGFINSKLISYLNRYINRHLTLPQHKIDDYRKSDYSKHLSEPLKIIEAIKKAEIYASSALTLDEAIEIVKHKIDDAGLNFEYLNSSFPVKEERWEKDPHKELLIYRLRDGIEFGNVKHNLRLVTTKDEKNRTYWGIFLSEMSKDSMRLHYVIRKSFPGEVEFIKTNTEIAASRQSFEDVLDTIITVLEDKDNLENRRNIVRTLLNDVLNYPFGLISMYIETLAFKNGKTYQTRQLDFTKIESLVDEKVKEGAKKYYDLSGDTFYYIDNMPVDNENESFYEIRVGDRDFVDSPKSSKRSLYRKIKLVPIGKEHESLEIRVYDNGEKEAIIPDTIADQLASRKLGSLRSRRKAEDFIVRLYMGLGSITASSALTLEEAKERINTLKEEFYKGLDDNAGEALWDQLGIRQEFDNLSKESNPNSFVKLLENSIEYFIYLKGRIEERYTNVNNQYLEMGKLEESSAVWKMKGNVLNLSDKVVKELKQIFKGIAPRASSAITLQILSKSLSELMRRIGELGITHTFREFDFIGDDINKFGNQWNLAREYRRIIADICKEINAKISSDLSSQIKQSLEELLLKFQRLDKYLSIAINITALDFSEGEISSFLVSGLGKMKYDDQGEGWMLVKLPDHITKTGFYREILIKQNFDEHNRMRGYAVRLGQSEYYANNGFQVALTPVAIINFPYKGLISFSLSPKFEEYLISSENADETFEKELWEIKKFLLSSSPLTNVPNDGLGAVDFRAMDMLIQPQGSFRGLDFSPVRLSSSALEAMDLDKSLEGIKQMVSGSMRPAPQRLKEYISACIFKGKIDEKADDFILSMLDVFQLQAEEGIESAAQEREAVVLADTRRYVLPEKRLAASNSYSLN